MVSWIIFVCVPTLAHHSGHFLIFLILLLIQLWYVYSFYKGKLYWVFLLFYFNLVWSKHSVPCVCSVLTRQKIFKLIKCIFDGAQGRNRYDEQNGLHLRKVVGNLLDWQSITSFSFFLLENKTTWNFSHDLGSYIHWPWLEIAALCYSLIPCGFSRQQSYSLGLTLKLGGPLDLTTVFVHCMLI